MLNIHFVAFLPFYCDRTVFRLEAKWERERGLRLAKVHNTGLELSDSESATALYVGTLPMRLLAPTYLMSIAFVTILSYGDINFKSNFKLNRFLLVSIINLSDKLELLVKSVRGNILPSCKTPSHLDSYKNYWIYLANEYLPNNGKYNCTLCLLLHIHFSW